MSAAHPSVAFLFYSPVLSHVDVLGVCTTAFLIYFVRSALTSLVFARLATWGGVIKPSIRCKMTENLWYCLYYPCMLTVCYYVCHDEGFFPWNERHYFDVFPSYDDFTRKPSLYYLFMFQLSFYVQGLVAHVTFETKRKDFFEILIHHVVTIALMIVSYCASQHRVGLCVLFLHDMSDVLLYSTKVLHYLDSFGHVQYRRYWSAASHVAFVAFAVVFAVTRNYVFPVYIIYPPMVASRMFPSSQHITGVNNHMCPNSDCTDSFFVRPRAVSNGTSAADVSGWLASFFRTTHYMYDIGRTSWLEISWRTMCFGRHCFHSSSILVMMMMVLEMLHVFWMLMILRMVWKIAFAKQHAKQDIRSDDEDEEGVDSYADGKKLN